MKILCVGQAICDLYMHTVGPELFDGGDHELEAIPVYGGGDANNASIDLSKIGEEVALATKIGADTFGHQVLKLLNEAGVDTRFVSRDPEIPTSVHVIVLGEDCRGNAFLPGTAQCVVRADIPNEAIEWADHVHMVSVLSQPLLDGDGIADIFAYAKSLGKTTSMDLQLDVSRAANKDFIGTIEGALKNCDVFLPSFDEVTAVTGGLTDPLEMKEFFRKYDLKVFGCKLGAKGVFLTNYKEDIFLPTLYVGKPVDTLGCGDAFCSGFVAAYLRGFSLEGCGLIGSAASAKICGIVGCSAGMRPFEELVQHARDMGYDPK